MAPSLARRSTAAFLAAAVVTVGLGAFAPGTASAATTSLFSQPFHNRTADGDGAVVLPASANGATNVACLSASGNTTVVPKSCTSATDAQGSGKLRLTDNTTFKGGSLFAATSVPTVSGLDVSFNTYQYGSSATPADGIAFALAAVDPTNPLSPANFGAVGGALGYSTGVPQSTRVNGLAYGYLGFGFDVYGNFSNSVYQGTSCTSPAYISTSGRVQQQAVIRGPGNGTAGYCALNSTATTTSSPAVPLRGSTRAASKVPVEIVLNPGTTSITTASGLTVAARGYTMAFTPVGGTQRVLTGALPVVGSSLGFPSNWLDASGYPKQLAFGWVGSTGSQVDYHEVDEVKVVSLAAVSELTVEQTAFTQPTLSPGDPVSYAVTAGVDQGVDETAPVSVTDTLPAGVTPVGGSGTGWVCAPPSGQQITCTNSNGPFKANTDLPQLTITGTVTGSGVTPAVIRNNSIVTASSNDANPAYSNTAATAAPPSAPSNLAISPSSGPTGTSVSITGTNTANATAVQIGTAGEIAAGTATTYTQCSNNTAAAGCFTINAAGAIGISAMPAHANGAVQVKVVTLGAASSVTYTYTSVPGTPTVVATAGVLSATASWDAPANGGSAISGYTLTPYKNGVAQTAVQLASTVTSYTVSNASAGASYTFTVSAKNSNGTGVASSQSNAAVPYTVPSAPTGVGASAGTSAARVSWAAPGSNGYSPITGYVVTPYLNGVAQTAVTFDSTATTQTITGLTPGNAYTFVVAAKNAAGTGPASSASTAVTVNDAPSITSTPGRGEVGAAYNHQLVVSGGTAGYTFSVTDGSLPDGITLSGGGLLSGTPTAAGSSVVTVKVADSYGVTSTSSLTLVVVAAPSLTFTSTLPVGTVGSVYRHDLSYSGGTGPYTFSVSTGTLPAGLTLDGATGVLSGTPTASGNAAFTVKITDSLGQTDTRTASLAVRAVPGAPTTATATPGTTTARVTWTAPASDGNSPVTSYVVTPYKDGVAQTATTFAATQTTGTVAGLTPGTSYTFTVAARNAVGTGPASAASAAVTLRDAPYLTSTPGNGEVGVAYDQQLTTDGGNGAVTYTIASGALPDGVNLSGAGLLSGTPTADGFFTFRVRVTDEDGAATSRTFTVAVAPTPSLTHSSALPVGTVGTAYSQTMTRTGGTGPFTFSVGAGALPAGLSLDTTSGVLSGTPSRAGDFSFTVKVVDSLGQSDTKETTLAVRSVPSAPIGATAVAGSTAAQVSWTAPTDDGNSTVTGYVVTPYRDGIAQTPVTFKGTSTTHTLEGLTAGSSYTFAVAAVNVVGTGPASAASAAVTVNEKPSITNTPGDGEVGVAYRQQLTSVGGTGALAYDVASGDLPGGLGLSAAGVLSGTPTAGGAFTFKVRVTDSTGASTTKGFTVVVTPAPTLTFDARLADAERGKAYSADLTRDDGTGPFTWSLSAGALPAGLTLDPLTGTLAGTPTKGGTYAFTVKVVDALGASDTKATTLLVKAPADVALAVSDTTVRIGETVRLTATLDPSSSTGSVVFTAAGPGGVRVEVGSAKVSGGRASVETTLPAFGTYTVVAAYGGDATHLGASSGPQTVEVAAYAGEVVVTELRSSGPGGAEDSYAEIYNTGSPVPLAGFVVRSGSGAKVVLPADAPVLGTYRTYLVAGRDFSLTKFATPDQTGSLGTGGLQLVAPDTAATVTDAVGPDKGLHLGRALPALSGTPTAQWAFVRVEKAGRPVNSGQNGSDFALVSSDGGKVGGVQSMRGSASPTGLGDDWQHDEQAQSYLLDSSVAVDAVPNRPYVAGKPGILEIRRTITNTGTSTMTSAKVRVTALSEANGLPYWGANQPAAPAAIRAVNPRTATSTAQVTGRGTVVVQNLKVDAPITAAAGGGLNSTFTVPLPDGGLAPGASVDVAFTFEVDVRGTFWFGYDVDARTVDQARVAGKLQSKVSAKTVKSRLAATGKTRAKTVDPQVRGTL